MKQQPPLQFSHAIAYLLAHLVGITFWPGLQLPCLLLDLSPAHAKGLPSHRTPTPPRSELTQATVCPRGLQLLLPIQPITLLTYLPCILWASASYEKKIAFQRLLNQLPQLHKVIPYISKRPWFSVWTLTVTYRIPNRKTKCQGRNFPNALLFTGGLLTRGFCSFAQIWTACPLGLLREAYKK